MASSPNSWNELSVARSPAPKVTNLAIGHDGQHALIVCDDGLVYFAGTARRGEDGEQSKNRRQPKPVKPKKMTRVEGIHIVQAACNSGSSALVSKEGDVYVFGKDSSHSDYTTGQVTDLKGIPMTQVAVGKAHVVTLSKTGEVFTFGMNNKGQCGREFSGPNASLGASASGAAAIGAVGPAPAISNEEANSDNEDSQQGKSIIY